MIDNKQGSGEYAPKGSVRSESLPLASASDQGPRYCKYSHAVICTYGQTAVVVLRLHRARQVAVRDLLRDLLRAPPASVFFVLAKIGWLTD